MSVNDHAQSRHLTVMLGSSRSSHGYEAWNRLSIGVACVMICFVHARAQSLDPARRISQYGHTVWRAQDGQVAAGTPITQTADGYIWMASQAKDKLIRFDGNQFVPWRPPKDHPLPGKITFLLGTRDGSLWIGTRAGVSRLKDGQLSTITKPSDTFGVSVMLEDRSGKIWLTRYRAPKGEGGLCEIGDHGVHCFGASEGVPAAYGIGLAEDPSGDLWFAGAELYRWKPGTEAAQYFNSSDHPGFIDVAADRSGDVWATMQEVGPRFGVRYFHAGAWGEYSAGKFRSSTLKSSTLLADRAGAVWIGTDNDGLYRVWNGSVDHYSRSDGLTGHSIAFFYEDHEGNLWVSTDGGVDMFRNTPVTTFSMDEGLTSDNHQTVLATSDGTVWAGSQESNGEVAEQLADVLRPGTDQRFSKGPALPGRVGAMLQDHSGDLWLALEQGQLVVYRGGRVEKVLAANGQPLRETVTAIYEDRSQTILALTETQLLRLREERVLESVALPKPQLTGGFLAANPGGGSWVVGKKEGVALYRNGKIEDHPVPAPNSPLLISGVVADSLDPLILATAAGLFRWNGNSWDVVNETNGLPCNMLRGAIKDRHGALWLSADCGLLRIEASALQHWRDNPRAPVALTIFDALDGARPISKALGLEPSMSLGPDGKVWLATGGVIQVIDPDHIHDNRLPPPVHVDRMIADAKSFNPSEPLRLPPNTHNLEIDYTAPSFSAPQKVLFRYFLEGHDESWQGPVTRRQAFYNDLPPGKYKFHVIASNNSGVWNERGAVADFAVEPTFYQTVWFKSVIAIGVIGLLWALYAFRLRRATAKVQDRLWAQMEERERIARELHDTLLQGFQGITLRVQGVAKNISDQDPLRMRMDDVLDRADDIMREARHSVRKLRQRTADENELPDRLTKRGEELAKDHAATFTIAIVGEPRILESTLQDEVFRIAGEALTNAFRHASASNIETEVSYDALALRIRVRDDGRGIDKAVLSNGHPDHWGLTGMRERAKIIRAELDIWSRAAAGTEVELVVPASIAYPRARSR